MLLMSLPGKICFHEDRWAVLKAPDPTQTPEHLQAQDWRQRAAALEAQMAADSSSQLSQLWHMDKRLKPRPFNSGDRQLLSAKTQALLAIYVEGRQEPTAAQMMPELPDLLKRYGVVVTADQAGLLHTAVCQAAQYKAVAAQGDLAGTRAKAENRWFAKALPLKRGYSALQLHPNSLQVVKQWRQVRRVRARLLSQLQYSIKVFETKTQKTEQVSIC
jgi:hypothetical protein